MGGEDSQDTHFCLIKAQEEVHSVTTASEKVMPTLQGLTSQNHDLLTSNCLLARSDTVARDFTLF